MKSGDKWNWAFVITGIVLLAAYLNNRYFQTLFAWQGGYHNNVAGGIALFGLPILVSPILFVFGGIAGFLTKSTRPLIGTGIGLGLYYPFLALIAILATGIRSISPSMVPFVLPVTGIMTLLYGMVRKPSQKRNVFQPTSPGDVANRAAPEK